jgi:DNA-binding NarL/FixJ family response regulator
MLLFGEPDIEVVAEASTGVEAVDKAARFRATVVLMDIRMPELDGLQATRRILAADEAARILILTTFDLDEYVYEALRAGARGFVLKDDPPEQRPRAGRASPDRARPLQRRDRPRALHQRRDRQDSHHAHPPEAQPPRPSPGVVLAHKTGLFATDEQPRSQSEAHPAH